MNDSRIPNIKSAHHVRKTSSVNEPMEVHLSVSRPLGLNAADMDANTLDMPFTRNGSKHP
jgi:hypothetical protein